MCTDGENSFLHPYTSSCGKLISNLKKKTRINEKKAVFNYINRKTTSIVSKVWCVLRNTFRVHQWAKCYEATVTLSVNKVLKCGWRVTHSYNNHMQIWVNKQRDIWALYPKEIK